MKKWILLYAIFFLGACTSTHQIDINVSKNVVLNSTLPKSLVKQFKKRINSNGYLEVEVILYSTFAKDVIYKIDWLDKDGFILRDVINENYQTLRIPAGQEVVIRKLAADSRVEDCKIEIKAKN